MMTEKKSPCMTFCGTQAIDEMMSKCSESMGGKRTAGLAEMMAACCEGMTKNRDWREMMKAMCSGKAKKTTPED